MGAGRNQSVEQQQKKKEKNSTRPSLLLLLLLLHGRSRVCGKYNWAKNNYLFRSIRGTTFQLARDDCVSPENNIIVKKFLSTKQAFFHSL